jgi:predicted metal-dependent HD superfamily phosphohydrolase
MNYSAWEENADRLVTQFFESPHRVHYPYHNLAHTKAVVEHAKEITAFYSLEEKDACIISIAAWFHDIGQLFGEMKAHEERSVRMMNKYLMDMDVPTDFIQSAGNCIMVTKCGSNPQSLPERIICDADTYHFGTPVFRETEFMVEKEMEIRTGQKFPQWHARSLALLQNHFFYTEYCQLLLKQGKQENIAWLRSLINGNQAGNSSD